MLFLICSELKKRLKAEKKEAEKAQKESLKKMEQLEIDKTKSSNKNGISEEDISPNVSPSNHTFYFAIFFIFKEVNILNLPIFKVIITF